MLPDSLAVLDFRGEQTEERSGNFPRALGIKGEERGAYSPRLIFLTIRSGYLMHGWRWANVQNLHNHMSPHPVARQEKPQIIDHKIEASSHASERRDDYGKLQLERRVQI